MIAVILRSGAALLLRRGEQWEFPAVSSLGELGLEAELGAEVCPGAVLVPRFTGALKPEVLARSAWVPANQLRERPLVPEAVPVAEAVAAHRRRPRYKGTHPRRFEEKYKEHRADPEAVAKAVERGSTPAGAHLPVMLEEVVAALEPLSGARALDCTLGWGGHCEALLRRAASVIALDRDGEELARTEARLRAQGLSLTARRCDYADAPEVLKALGVDGVDALLADLGVSSMQLDRPERGMSFKNDGPLDMRMDRSRGPTAAEWLATATREAIAEALALYGDEPDAEAVAAALSWLAAQGRAPKTTRELAEAVSLAKGLGGGKFRKKDPTSKHPAARTFQALRIAVNAERDSLSRLLAALPGLVRPGGRAALLTFHSGEEALVGAALRAQAALWEPLPPPQKPSPEEVRRNPRARSARLWRAVRRRP